MVAYFCTLVRLLYFGVDTVAIGESEWLIAQMKHALYEQKGT